METETESILLVPIWHMLRHLLGNALALRWHPFSIVNWQYRSVFGFFPSVWTVRPLSAGSDTCSLGQPETYFGICHGYALAYRGRSSGCRVR